jgi:hypothetical protein
VAVAEAEQVTVEVHDVCISHHTLQHLDVTAGICHWRVQLLFTSTSSTGTRSTGSSSCRS